MNIKEFYIFRNNKKQSEKQPDRIMAIKASDGSWDKIGACWLRDQKGKVEASGKPIQFLSCKLENGLQIVEEQPSLTEEEKHTLDVAMKNAMPKDLQMDVDNF